MEFSDVVLGGRYVFTNHDNPIDRDNGAVVIPVEPDDYEIESLSYDFKGVRADNPNYQMLFNAKELSEVAE